MTKHLTNYESLLPLDVLIIEENPYIPSDIHNFLLTNSNLIIHPEKICSKSSYSEIKSFPLPTDTCLVCTSSGSTGTPKLIRHTHNFFYELCSFNWKSLEFKENDNVLHSLTFHHGSSLGIYFLTSLRKCKNHFFYAVDIKTNAGINMLIDFCLKNKITKLNAIYSSMIDDLISSLEKSNKNLSNLTIITLSYINPNWITAIKKGRIKKIISVFGCSETSGPLFVSSINKSTKNFDPTNYGNPIKGFFKIKLDNKKELSVTIPMYNQTIKTEDFFEKTNKGYLFIGKNKSYRINDIVINVNDLKKIIQNNSNDVIIDDVIIIVDEIYNKLYVVTRNKNVKNNAQKIKKEIGIFYNKQVKLSKLIYINHLKEFLIGIKPDREKLLDYIRQMEAKN